jgi:hypothetical protein
MLLSILRSMLFVSNRPYLVLIQLSIEKSAVSIVPDFSQATTDAAIANLKNRINGTRPLGMVRSDTSELLVIYDGKCAIDVLGCNNSLIQDQTQSLAAISQSMVPPTAKQVISAGKQGQRRMLTMAHISFSSLRSSSRFATLAQADLSK